MTAPKVAVVIRTKNRPLLLARALGSALCQSMGDLAVVVVNEGGDQPLVDGVVAAAEDPRVMLVHHDVSRGRSAAANAGISAVVSDFWVILDDDDTWDVDFLAITSDWLEGHVEAGGVAAPVEVVYERVDGDQVHELRRDSMFGPHAVSLADLVTHNYVTTNSLLVRRSASDQVGLYDPELPVLEDWDFNLRLAAQFPIGHVDGRALAFWHHRQDSTGDEGNSITQDASAHADYDTVVRDLFLRRELAAGQSGLGTVLNLAHTLRRISDNADQARAQQSRVADRWNEAHRQHLDSVHGDLKLELGRLRGEVLALREETARMQGELAQELTQVTTSLDRLRVAVSRVKDVVRANTRPLRGAVEGLAQQVEDLWRTEPRVARLARRRSTP